MFEWVDEWWQFSPFAFVIMIILITSFFSYLKQSDRERTLREALKSGQPLDADFLKTIEEREDGGGGTIVGGFITLAVAVGLVIMAYQIQSVDGDKDILPIMIGVAAIPGLIGIVLIVSGLISNGRKKSDS